MRPLFFVVDGVSERRSVVQQILEQIGYRVEAFATTRALDLAEQLCPSLIIVAIELPDRNGIVLREKIRANRRTLIDSSPHKQVIKFLEIREF